MNFEQLKVVWDEQHSEKLYAYDEAAFAQLIETKCLDAKRRSILQDWALIAIFLFSAAFLATKHFAFDEGNRSLFGLIFSLGAAAYVFFRRQLKNKSVNRFDQSLAGLLSQAVLRQKNIVRLGSTMIIWLGIPYAIYAAANFFIYDTDSPAWLFPLMLIPIPLMYIVVRFGLRKAELPKLRELEEIQRKFSESP